MRFHPTIAENRKRLLRIAAWLCALADLAERAAGRSGAICHLMLWLLRPAETVACDYVHNLAPGASRPPELMGSGDGRTEILRLAQSLRWLAAIIAALAAHCRAPLMAAPVKHMPTVLRPTWTAAVARLDSS